MRVKKGFSLLELAIVISLSAVMMTVLLKMYSSVQNIQVRSRVDDNIVHTKKVQNAIRLFFKKHDRIPCPADPTLSRNDPKYGVEFNDNCLPVEINSYYKPDGISPEYNMLLFLQNQSQQMVYNGNISIHVDNSYVFGAIPFKSMGLDESYMYDTFGNKFTYTVSNGYAKVRTQSPYVKGWTRISLPTKLKGSAYMSAYYVNVVNGAEEFNRNNYSSNPGIDCKNIQNTSSNFVITTLTGGAVYLDGNDWIGHEYIANSCLFEVLDLEENVVSSENLAYVLISHGQNGLGAWNKQGKTNPQPTDVNEQKNTFYYYKFKNGTLNRYVSSVVTNSSINQLEFRVGDSDTFDDYLIFDTPDSLLEYAGRGDNLMCHQSTIWLDINNARDLSSIFCSYWESASSKTNSNYFKYYKTTSNGDQYCPSTFPNKGSLNCLSGGVWGGLG